MAPTTGPRDSACPSHRLGAGFPERRAKRVKLQHDSSPEPSTVSDDSALMPTSVTDDTTDATDNDSDVSSVLSESSEEPSDESSEEDSDEDDGDVDNEVDDEGEVVNLRANRGEKPVMKFEKYEAEDVRPFLKDFLPKLKAANDELEAQRRAGTLETAEMDEGADEEGQRQYIEMNLGLGVLEAESDGLGKNSSGAGDSNDGPPQDVLDALMGREKQTVGVQVVEEKPQEAE